MAIEFENPLTAGTVLIRSDIRSQNFVAGSSGWRIEADGDAEFNSIIIRGGTVISGEAFYYDPAPGPGNLILSISPNSGTDPYGNDYLEGVVSYSGPVFTALAVGALRIGITADGYPTAGIVSLLGADGIVISSPTSVSNPDPATAEFVDGDTTVTPQSSASYPHLDVGAATSGTTQWINGAVIRSTVSAGVSTPETWHNPTFTGTWTGATTLNGSPNFQSLQYRKDAEDNVWISGGATTSGAGASVFTLPAGYRNTTTRHMLPCWIFDSSAGTVQGEFVQVTEAGVVNLATTLSGITIAAGDQIYINGKFPLGNIG